MSKSDILDQSGFKFNSNIRGRPNSLLKAPRARTLAALMVLLELLFEELQDILGSVANLL